MTGVLSVPMEWEQVGRWGDDVCSDCDRVRVQHEARDVAGRLEFRCPREVPDGDSPWQVRAAWVAIAVVVAAVATWGAAWWMFR